MKYIRLMILILMLTGCGLGLTEEHPQLSDDVKDAVASGEESVSLTDYGDDEWKEMYLFWPYTQDDAVEESLGTSFNGPSVSLSDRHFLLVLVDAEGVKYALLPRSVAKAGGNDAGHEEFINTDYSLDRDSEEIIIDYRSW
ncbi:hypothetical protein [Salsuginibacillus kocurii]|uniref:hypothetical protein n=1 Tax=Salsuginibacillus kocurii TaxID=427078 RepID=UPI000370EAF9|nr:hypothetical protein [Salsuginibacillus kocurii]